MATVINFPEARVGQLRAVQYSSQNVVIYDDATDPRLARWEENDLDAATAWMEAVDGYLRACAAYKASPTRENDNRASATFLSLRVQIQGVALKIARDRLLLC